MDKQIILLIFVLHVSNNIMKKKNNPSGVSTTPYFKKVKALSLVNENTGEIYPDGSTVNVATDLVIISYDEYVIFNSDALNSKPHLSQTADQSPFL